MSKTDFNALLGLIFQYLAVIKPCLNLIKIPQNDILAIKKPPLKLIKGGFCSAESGGFEPPALIPFKRYIFMYFTSDSLRTHCRYLVDLLHKDKKFHSHRQIQKVIFQGI